ncbi:NAD-dependent protein deacetylase sirtuin-1 isoform X2 [Electrophorus electricus]|uniref:protein acetyllysine N-acetyltransferase n=1 Tax=Electrophorus electricus TaxID=8005 RepID=A0A4W4GG29_ELEEL|nr:NAD-dependent protein deacetylase sirtuin-1 isoform X2 [Electrophorus electricus]
MADGENKLVGAKAGSDGIEEPMVKKPRISILQNRGMDIIRGEHITCGAESDETWAAAILTRPEGAEMAVSQATALAKEEDKVSVIWEPSEDAYSTEKTSVSGPESELSGIMDDSVHPNGFYSPDVNEDDDCSSHASSSDWTPQPQIGSYHFIQQHIMRETDPRTILKDLLPETVLSPDLDDMTLWQIIINISEPPKRKKRKDINTLEDVVRLLNDGKKILVLTGAGVSVSCGIPDFRSRDGIYARLAIDFPDLPDPQAMFDIEYFRRDPRPFFKFAKEIYPGQFQPSLCHRFISMLDNKEKLLRNYTQNIDTLEQVAGVQRIIQCHGSFATASCLVCKHKVDCEAIREDVFKQIVPHCPRCSDVPFAIMKPDIVFFGENLPELFHRAMKQDKNEVDLLIVIGSSLKVRPVALIPSSVPHEVPQVLINREPLPHLNFDVELLGDCDVIVNELCHLLGGDFEQLCYNSSPLSEITEKPPLPEKYTEVQSLEVQNTDAGEASTESSEAITSIYSRPNVQLPKDVGTNVSPSAATEARSYLEFGNLSTNLPIPSEKREVSPNTPKRTSPCPGSSVSCQKAPIEVDDFNLNKQYQKGDIPDRLEAKNEEGLKHRHHNNEVWKKWWLSQIHRNPISKRLGAHQYLFQTPNRYIFHGAEVYSCSEDETSSSCDSEGSCCSGNGLEEEESDAEAASAPEQSMGDGENDVRRTICDSKCTTSLSTDNMTENLHTITDF